MVRGWALFFRGMLGLIVSEKEDTRGGPQVSEDAGSLVPAPLGDIILEFEVSDWIGLIWYLLKRGLLVSLGASEACNEHSYLALRWFIVLDWIFCVLKMFDCLGSWHLVLLPCYAKGVMIDTTLGDYSWKRPKLCVHQRGLHLELVQGLVQRTRLDGRQFLSVLLVNRHIWQLSRAAFAWPVIIYQQDGFRV